MQDRNKILSFTSTFLYMMIKHDGVKRSVAITSANKVPSFFERKTLEISLKYILSILEMALL